MVVVATGAAVVLTLVVAEDALAGVPEALTGATVAATAAAGVLVPVIGVLVVAVVVVVAVLGANADVPAFAACVDVPAFAACADIPALAIAVFKRSVDTTPTGVDTVVAPAGIVTGAGATVLDEVVASGNGATGGVCATVAAAVVVAELPVGVGGASKVATAGGTIESN